MHCFRLGTFFDDLTWGLCNMLPAQLSNLSSYLKGFSLLAVVSSVRAWVRQEIVDDDPWDIETLQPSSSIPLEESAPQDPSSEKSIF